MIVIVIFTTITFASRPDFRIHTGISKPFAPTIFKEGWTTSANVGVGISKKILNHTSVYLDMMYNHFTINNNSFIENQGFDPLYSNLDGDNWFILTGNIGLKKDYPMINNPKLIPFFTGSFGILKSSRDRMRLISSSDSDSEYTESIIEKIDETAFSFYLGLGFDVNMEKSKLFVEIGLVTGLTEEKTSYLPIKVGISF